MSYEVSAEKPEIVLKVVLKMFQEDVAPDFLPASRSRSYRELEVLVSLIEGSTLKEEVLRKAILYAGFKPVDVHYGTDNARADENEPDEEES